MTELRAPDFAREVLEGKAAQQHGVPGMKWGQRKARRSAPSNPRAEKVAQPKTFKARPQNRRMTDAELRNKVNRLQMEKQFADLSKPTAKTKSFTRQILEDSGKQFARQAASRAVNVGLQLALEGAAKNAKGGNKVFFEAMAAAGGKKKKG